MADNACERDDMSFGAYVSSRDLSKSLPPDLCHDPMSASCQLLILRVPVETHGDFGPRSDLELVAFSRVWRMDDSFRHMISHNFC